MSTLVVDVNSTVVVVYHVETASYMMFYERDYLKVERMIAEAKVVVTFNGNRYDMHQRPFPKPLTAQHVDVMRLCWLAENDVGQRRWFGRGLTDIFQEVCPGEVAFQEIVDPYERKQYLDVFMTMRLWETWLHGKLIPPPPKVSSAA